MDRNHPLQLRRRQRRGGPAGTLVFDNRGNLYGGYDGGLFELSPPAAAGGAWTKTNLPSAGLQQGSKLLYYIGNFYGVTQDGGTAGKGTAFVLKPPTTNGGSWTLRVIHNFGVVAGDGTVPMAGLTLHNGSLYGTTNQGGASLGGSGVVFELTPKNGVWTYTILYDFIANENGGGAPFGPLVFDPAGNIYGTTSGESVAFPNPGGVYELSPPSVPGNPWQETILSNFTDGTNGISPMAGVIRDAANNLYGTTYYGGGTHSLGVVFKLNPPKVAGGTWTEVVLRKFAGAPSDGAHPSGELILLNGALYGTTSAGGVNITNNIAGGTVLSLVP